MAFDPRDPDAALVALFRHHAEENPAKSATAGRPIFDDVEVVDIRRAGAKDFGTYPAASFCDWVTDPQTGQQRKRTYAERFQRQYRQFKEQVTQTKAGTPLSHVPFLTEARRAELRALNIYTVEALAHVDGQELKNLGPYGREIKNQAEAFMAEAKLGAPNIQVLAELEALRSRAQLLEEDNVVLKQKAEAAQFDDMSETDLANYIRAQTGTAPIGQGLGRKTLLRMAVEARGSRVAA